MTPDDVRRFIFDALGDSGADVCVESTDGRHFSATVVSDAFEDMSLVQRHRFVMGALKKQISSDAIHAISLSLLTQTERRKKVPQE